jgi:hypothetical protein
MTLQSSGNPISFSQIRAEFGDGVNTATSPVRLGQYRRDDGSFSNKNTGSLTNMPLDTGVPTSGEIATSNFYDKQLNVVVNYHTSNENRPEDAKTRYNSAATSTGNSTGKWNVIGGYKNPPSNTSGTKVMINVNKEIGSVRGIADDGSDRNKVALRTGSSWTAGTTLQIDIGSSGRIQGGGGDGGAAGSTSGDTPDTGNTGTSGLGVEYAAQINNSGIIRCGYGGGGGGSGGSSDPNKSSTDFGRTGGGGGGGAGIPFGLGAIGFTPADSGSSFTGGDKNVPNGGSGSNGTKDAGGDGGAAPASEGGAEGGAGGNGADQNDTSATVGGTGAGGGRGYDDSSAGSAGGINGFGIIFSNSTIQSNSTGDVTLDTANGGVSNSAGIG